MLMEVGVVGEVTRNVEAVVAIKPVVGIAKAVGVAAEVAIEEVIEEKK